jgi:hypothetical protein
VLQTMECKVLIYACQVMAEIIGKPAIACWDRIDYRQTESRSWQVVSLAISRGNLISLRETYPDAEVR